MADVGLVEFPYVCSARWQGHEDSVFLPYSQSLWDSLVVIGGKMADLSDKLKDLLGSEEGRAKLESAMSGLLLPAPPASEDEDL